MILRAEKRSNYTRIPNEFLLDDTISDKARGLLARLLSRPDNWNLNINYLVKTGKDGHTAIRSAIRELEKAEYLQKEVTRHKNGRIIGVEYIIHESPVKSCGDKPAPEPEQSCVEEVAGKENEITLPDPEPEPGGQEIQAQDAHNQGAHTEVISVKDNHMRKTQNKETTPIIKTDIKQILRETTTTAPEPNQESVICDQAMPSLSCAPNAILNLIPEQHRSPVVLSLVNKAIVAYPEREVQEAVAYAAGNVRGGSMQFRAYLDKTRKNKWAEGYFESMQEPGAYGVTWLHPRAKYPNGTVTGSKRMDANYMVAAQFLNDMGVDVNQMCAEA